MKQAYNSTQCHLFQHISVININNYLPRIMLSNKTCEASFLRRGKKVENKIKQ